MSPGTSSRGHNESSSDQSEVTKSDIDHIVALLCDGDITKREDVLWNCSFNDIKPFSDIQLEKAKFRKSVMAFLGVKEKPDTDPTDEEYLASIAHFKHRKGTHGKHS